MTQQTVVGMPADEVLTIIDWLEANRLTYQVNGGWAVDAPVGPSNSRASRPRPFLDATAMDLTVDWLTQRGYRADVDWLPTRLELARGSERVDMHPMRLDGQMQWRAERSR